MAHLDKAAFSITLQRRCDWRSPAMHRALLPAAIFFAATCTLLTAAPARAQYGAIAYDPGTHRDAWTFNHRTPRGAEEDALRRCGSRGCRVVLQIGPGMCGALATEERGTAWGSADRPRREEARIAAVENCRRRSSTPCVVRVTDCNR
jgi:hypothetical protein